MGSLGSSLPVGRMSRFNVQMQDFSSSTYECIGRAFERLLWTLGSGAEGYAMSCWENCWESCWRGSARKRDRKSVVRGKRVSVSVDPGGRRIIKQKNMNQLQRHNHT